MARATSRTGNVQLGLSVLITLFAAAFAMALASDLQASYSLGNSAYVVYDNTLGWQNWSWRTVVNPNVSSPALTGKSMAVTFSSAWAGLSLHNPNVDTSTYSHLQFAIFPGGATFPTIDVSLYNAADALIQQVDPRPYASAGGDGWYRVSIPLADLGGAHRTITRVQLQDASGGAQATFYLDDFQFVNPQAATSKPTSQQAAPPKPTFGAFRPPEASWEVDEAIREAAARFNLPRWFYYAIVERESSFDPEAVGPLGEPGLTQLNGPNMEGTPYPMNLNAPDDWDMDYYYDMNFSEFGRWIKMSQVSPLDDPFDAGENLARFSSGFAVPAYYLFRQVYGLDANETLRSVAYHWNKGVYRVYDPNNWNYLDTYDQYVDRYRPVVEAEDGDWNGRPVLP